MSEQQNGGPPSQVLGFRPRDIVRAVLVVALVIFAGIVLWYWHEPLWVFFGDPARIREWVLGFGPWGPLISVALNTAQVLLAPIPGQFVGLANGYLYGVGMGTLYSMVGLLLGTMLAMGLGRWFGRPLVERLVNPETLARWDRIADRQGLLFFFLVFLFPLVPDDVACFLFGLSPLSIPRMLFLAMLGRLPGVFVSCWIGAYATTLPWWAWIPLGGGSAGLAWLFWRYQAWLEGWVVRLIQRIVKGEA
ncbi:MAG: VTT domain-containing protein [Chloroflexota bacterium]|nr:VTT domain-containing protein [Chloroflexota bacterium]